MHDASHAAWLLTAALLASVLGMAWLALAMPAHGQQVWGAPVSPERARVLRGLGSVALAVSLALCLASDHASMAALVWIMSLAAAAFLVAMTLAWHPRWLARLAPWAGRADTRATR
ncbi:MULTISPECIES: DUF3325 domain-containing protein [Luteimonas]|uniref:DUF3325 domain-containing protein n=1 Tax=Luteimonas terrae TaxID=1530191 RepID=A0ABU1Y0N8_9GAMM|nr:MULTISPECIES: DUF3325 domain-containing protein [Luteimonas]MDR6990717.1 hypothetical protein [Luteimonas sp. 3794]MDR7194595.1 hypothetical protein [Luteimonas terrae]